MTTSSVLPSPAKFQDPSSEGGVDSAKRREPSQDLKTWLHVLSHLHPKYGGVSAVVPQLNSALADTGRYAIQLAAFCEGGEQYFPVVSQNVNISHLPISHRAYWEARNPKELRSMFSSSGGVHIHGLWQQSTALAASAARKQVKPYIISAHGMLEPWALANKRWKKKLYLALVEKNNLQSASCLHALTRAEVEDYRRLGLRAPIAIIPNGVLLPTQRSGEAFLHEFPALAGKRLVLFLGRIHFKKGLDILCQAWARVAKDSPDSHLVLGGPDFEGTRGKVEQLLHELKIVSRVTFTGMLAGELKWSALAAAELFVLPSYSEGLSVSTLEAMGMGKPVLITENCHLPEAAQFGCGMVIGATANQLEDALKNMLSKSSSALQAMGACGEHLVRSRYSWAAIGDQMSSLYRWIEGGPKPTNVEIDFPTGEQS